MNEGDLRLRPLFAAACLKKEDEEVRERIAAVENGTHALKTEDVRILLKDMWDPARLKRPRREGRLDADAIIRDMTMNPCAHPGGDAAFRVSLNSVLAMYCLRSSSTVVRESTLRNFFDRMKLLSPLPFFTDVKLRELFDVYYKYVAEVQRFAQLLRNRKLSTDFIVEWMLPTSSQLTFPVKV